MPNNDPTQETLHKYFEYDGEHLRWKKRAPYSHVKIGDIAGRRTGKERRLQYCVDGVVYPGARILWIYHNGPIPEGYYVDHADQDPTNDSLDNLRLALPRQNSSNKRSNRYKHEGWRGVYQQRRGLIAGVRSKGKFHYLGCFSSHEDAATAYNFAAAKLHGEFAVFNSVYQPWLEELNAP